MARGWESKSVEAQQEEAWRVGRVAPGVSLSTDQRANLARRRVLMLARVRTLADLERATAPAQRTMLERALSDLDREIAELT